MFEATRYTNIAWTRVQKRIVIILALQLPFSQEKHGDIFLAFYQASMFSSVLIFSPWYLHNSLGLLYYAVSPILTLLNICSFFWLWNQPQFSFDCFIFTCAETCRIFTDVPFYRKLPYIPQPSLLAPYSVHYINSDVMDNVKHKTETQARWIVLIFNIIGQQQKPICSYMVFLVSGVSDSFCCLCPSKQIAPHY